MVIATFRKDPVLKLFFDKFVPLLLGKGFRATVYSTIYGEILQFKECGLINTNYTCRNGYSGQGAAVTKGKLVNAGKALRQIHRDQIGTLAEGKLIHGGDTLGDGQAAQAGTATERLLAYGPDLAGNGHGSQLGTMQEGIATDFSQLIRQVHGMIVLPVDKLYQTMTQKAM